MRTPKFGVLDYMLRGFSLDGERDLVFVPLGLNYDRTLEDRTLLLGDDPGTRRPGRLRAAWNTLRFIGHQVGLVLRSRWFRFGYACVNFGTPVSAREYLRARNIDLRHLSRDERVQVVGGLGRHLMEQVGRLIPVLPVPLMASVLLRTDGAISELELKSSVATLVRALEENGARIYVPRSDWDYAVAAGLRMLVLRHLVSERDGLFAANAAERPLLRYYANSIRHLLPEPLRA